MADTLDLARVREALAAPAAGVDASVLVAVHDGLLSMPVAAEPGRRDHDDEAPRLAVRRRTGF
ncbi:hypothetical protein N866_18630 [Actinotalea ferrariae CF5-4]|uniref:Uncharacterized protein n=1 Tax=Actinotalea ferrariae CF5-4 TaxID=948458 RepID=A0A021VXB9_9CELL|nr:hypothetical protein [Actinotalea ferrariae]EYR63727.1 hypothetical protein N866_18630 [Actinotalea ferrariae CF5-4]